MWSTFSGFLAKSKMKWSGANYGTLGESYFKFFDFQISYTMRLSAIACNIPWWVTYIFSLYTQSDSSMPQENIAWLYRAIENTETINAVGVILPSIQLSCILIGCIVYDMVKKNEINYLPWLQIYEQIIVSPHLEWMDSLTKKMLRKRYLERLVFWFTHNWVTISYMASYLTAMLTNIILR